MTSSDTSGWSLIRGFTTGALPVPPFPRAPVNGAINVTVNPLFVWTPPSGVDSFQLQVATTSSFDSAVVNVSGIQQASYQVRGLRGRTQYYWRLNSTNNIGTSDWSLVYSFTTEQTTSVNVKPTGNEIPTEFQLRQNYPNPFSQVPSLAGNTETNIVYELPKSATVRLSVYNTTGQEIVALVDDYQLPGVYSVQWNGKDRLGRNLASGIYFYRLYAGDFVQTRKLAITR
jgi:hypothetical protein